MKRILCLILVGLAWGSRLSAATFVVSASFPVFSPSSLTISAGDTVEWQTLSGHTASETSSDTTTAYDGSGFRGSGVATFDQAFPSPGTYYYICEIHIGFGMRGVIFVLPAATPTISPTFSVSPTDTDSPSPSPTATATPTFSMSPTPGASASPTPPASPTPSPSPYVVSASFPVFNPSSLTISVGSTVEWQTLNGHTVSEASSDTATAYDGTGFRGGFPGETITAFDQTFNSPGTYNYICEVHIVPYGMRGVVFVLPAGTPLPSPGPTQTPQNTPTPSGQSLVVASLVAVPNPSPAVFQVDLLGPGQVVYDVYSSGLTPLFHGRSPVLGAGWHSLPFPPQLSSLANGLYYVRAWAVSGVYRQSDPTFAKFEILK
jgi:plastocyanin